MGDGKSFCTGVDHSLVVPVYNEEAVLPELFARLTQVREALAGERLEVIFVNDGSTDRSGHLLSQAQSEQPLNRVVHLSRNFGHEAALAAGIHFSQGKTVTVMDADLQDPPELIPRFMEEWRRGFEIVYGVRASRKGEPRHKRWTAALYYQVLEVLAPDSVKPNVGNFYLLDRRVAELYRVFADRRRMARLFVLNLGFSQKEISYRREPRRKGKSHYGWHAMIQLGWDGIVSVSDLPLRLSYAAAFGVFGGALFLLTREGLSLHFSLYFLTSLLLGCLAILGEYLSRTYREVQHRPLYVVAALQGFSEPMPTPKAAVKSQPQLFF